MTWLSFLWRYRLIIGIGLALLSLVTWGHLYGKSKYNEGFRDGEAKAVIACKSASDKAQTTSTKITKDIIKSTRTSTYNDDLNWLDANGLLVK